jgi:hypothetical protein
VAEDKVALPRRDAKNMVVPVAAQKENRVVSTVVGVKARKRLESPQRWWMLAHYEGK